MEIIFICSLLFELCYFQKLCDAIFLNCESCDKFEKFCIELVKVFILIYRNFMVLNLVSMWGDFF
jgi:hypothetical protein